MKGFLMVEKRHYPKLLVLGLVIVIGGWLVFSLYVVPEIITSAYHGESSDVFNSVIGGRSVHPVEHYLSTWRRLSQGLLVLFLLSVLPFILLPFIWPRLRDSLQGGIGASTYLKPAFVNTVLSVLFLVFILYLYYLAPVGYVFFVAEDFWAEFGTFVTLAVAFCALAALMAMQRSTRRPGYVLIALAALFVAGEEISWGQRLLGFSTPQFLMEGNMQGETTLHNLDVVPISLNLAMGVAFLVWSLFIYQIDRKSAWAHRALESLGVPVVAVHLWPYFLIASLFLTFTLFPRSAEVGELLFGIAIAALAIDLLVSHGAASRGSAAANSVATLAMLAYALVYTGCLVHFFTPTEKVKQLLNNFAAEDLQEEGAYQQAAVLFEYLERKPEYVEPETGIAYGRLLLKMGRSSAATSVLDSALATQKQLWQDDPTSTEPIRNMAIVLGMLQRREEAQQMFQAAIDNDATRLQQSSGRTASLEIQRSLYTTYLEMGDCERMQEQLSSILALKPAASFLNHPKLRKRRARSACAKDTLFR